MELALETMHAKLKELYDHKNKFELHYEEKKKHFKETENECFQLTIKVKQLEEAQPKCSLEFGRLEYENSQLKQKVKRLEKANQEIASLNERLDIRVQSLVEEVKFFSEKGQTTTFENQALEKSSVIFP